MKITPSKNNGGDSRGGGGSGSGSGIGIGAPDDDGRLLGWIDTLTESEMKDVLKYMLLLNADAVQSALRYVQRRNVQQNQQQQEQQPHQEHQQLEDEIPPPLDLRRKARRPGSDDDEEVNARGGDDGGGGGDPASMMMHNRSRSNTKASQAAASTVASIGPATVVVASESLRLQQQQQQHQQQQQRPPALDRRGKSRPGADTDDDDGNDDGGGGASNHRQLPSPPKQQRPAGAGHPDAEDSNRPATTSPLASPSRSTRTTTTTRTTTMTAASIDVINGTNNDNNNNNNNTHRPTTIVNSKAKATGMVSFLSSSAAAAGVPKHSNATVPSSSSGSGGGSGSTSSHNSRRNNNHRPRPKKTLVVLCTMKPVSKLQASHQDQSMTLCREQGILPYIVLAEINADQTAELMQVSGPHYHQTYPQFFLQYGQQVEFLGDFGAVCDLHREGDFTPHFLLRVDLPPPKTQSAIHMEQSRLDQMIQQASEIRSKAGGGAGAGAGVGPVASLTDGNGGSPRTGTGTTKGNGSGSGAGSNTSNSTSSSSSSSSSSSDEFNSQREQQQRRTEQLRPPQQETTPSRTVSQQHQDQQPRKNKSLLAHLEENSIPPPDNEAAMGAVPHDDNDCEDVTDEDRGDVVGVVQAKTAASAAAAASAAMLVGGSTRSMDEISLGDDLQLIFDSQSAARNKAKQTTITSGMEERNRARAAAASTAPPAAPPTAAIQEEDEDETGSSDEPPPTPRRQQPTVPQQQPQPEPTCPALVSPSDSTDDPTAQLKSTIQSNADVNVTMMASPSGTWKLRETVTLKPAGSRRTAAASTTPAAAPVSRVDLKAANQRLVSSAVADNHETTAVVATVTAAVAESTLQQDQKIHPPQPSVPKYTIVNPYYALDKYAPTTTTERSASSEPTTHEESVVPTPVSPAEAQAEAQAEAPGEAPAESPAEAPAEELAEELAEEPAETPAETPAEEQAQAPPLPQSPQPSSVQTSLQTATGYSELDEQPIIALSSNSQPAWMQVYQQQEEDQQQVTTAAAVASSMVPPHGRDVPSDRGIDRNKSWEKTFLGVGACYLVYDAVEGELNIHYSEIPIIGAVGVWTTPDIALFKEAQNLSQSELIGNCASQVMTQDRLQYYNGWCQFVKAAKSMDATVTVLDGLGVPVDFFLYENGSTRRVENSTFETDTVDAVACVPKNCDFSSVQGLKGKKWTKAAKKKGAVTLFKILSSKDGEGLEAQGGYDYSTTMSTSTSPGAGEGDKQSVPILSASNPVTNANEPLSDAEYELKKNKDLPTQQQQQDLLPDPRQPGPGPGLEPRMEQTVLGNVPMPPSQHLLTIDAIPGPVPLQKEAEQAPIPSPRLSVETVEGAYSSAETAPSPTGGACYLLYEPDSSGRLVEHYSYAPVEGAIGRWVPGPSKKIAGFKFKRNLGRNVLIGNCSAGVQGRKNYCSGWCQFVRSAKGLDGEVMLWDPSGGAKGLMVDVYFYFQDSRSMHQTARLEQGKALSTDNLLAVCCIPKNTPFFEGMAVDILKWLADGGNYGYSSKM